MYTPVTGVEEALAYFLWSTPEMGVYLSSEVSGSLVVSYLISLPMSISLSIYSVKG